MHLMVDGYRPACGQDCYGLDYLTDKIDKVTCHKCLR